MDKSVLEMYRLLPYYKHGVVKNVLIVKYHNWKRDSILVVKKKNKYKHGGVKNELIVKYPNWKRQSILEVKKTNTNMVLAIEAILVGHDSFAWICFFIR